MVKKGVVAHGRMQGEAAAAVPQAEHVNAIAALGQCAGDDRGHPLGAGQGVERAGQEAQRARRVHAASARGAGRTRQHSPMPNSTATPFASA